ncbi:MAG: hypothetical protein K0Q72_4915, partial [Armatimonadetes bacterium]|nr:hypothetical protein [Armatimonadota bacterium]
MNKPRLSPAVARFLSDYGIIFVLLLLCAYYSWATYGVQQTGGRG